MSTTYDVLAAIDALGIDYTEHGYEAQSICPMHYERTGREDHSPSWWINLDTGMHICFSCGYKGNLVQLVADVKGFYTELWGSKERVRDSRAAEEWLANIAQITPEQMLEILKALPAYQEPIPRPLEMSEARLAVFTSPPQEQLDRRNITAESAQKYGVLWEKQTSRWILPLRDPYFSKLLGWQEKGTTDRYFRNRPAGLTKSKTLFGIENQNVDFAIIVESPLDCLRLYSAGVDGGLAICGSATSEEQVKLLRSSQKIIAAFDNPNIDSAGRKASKEMLNWARKYNLNLWFFNYGGSGKKDPGDMTDAEIRWGVENAQSALLGESAYVQGDPQTIPG